MTMFTEAIAKSRPDLAERDNRQRDLMPPDRLLACTAVVVGVGAVGRQVALQLASSGVPKLHLIDHDRVEVPNLAVQGFAESDLDKPKVDAVAASAGLLNGQITVTAHRSKFTDRVFGRVYDDVDQALVVFACVDSMAARKEIWGRCKVMSRTALYLDARMLGEVLNVYTIPPSVAAAVSYYESTLHDDSEANPGRCTARTSVFCANITAGMMVECLSQHLRGLSPPWWVNLSLTSWEISTKEGG